MPFRSLLQMKYKVSLAGGELSLGLSFTLLPYRKLRLQDHEALNLI